MVEDPPSPTTADATPTPPEPQPEQQPTPPQQSPALRLDARVLAAIGAAALVAIAALAYLFLRNDQPAQQAGTPAVVAQEEEDPWAGLAEYDRLLVRPVSIPRPVMGLAMRSTILSGHADVEFTVGADGKASDIRVVGESAEDLGYGAEGRRLVAAATWPTEWRGRTAPYAARYRVIFPPGRSGASAIAPISIASPILTEEILALGRNATVTLVVRVGPDGAVETAQIVDADAPNQAIAREAMRVAMGARFPEDPAGVGYETRLAVRFDVLAALGAREPVTTAPAASLSEVPFAQRPSSSDFSRHFPRRALNQGIEGRVTLVCNVRRDLRLACNIAEENPPGEGFGAAALRIARRFRAEREFPDGRPTVGAHVRVPMVFRVE